MTRQRTRHYTACALAALLMLCAGCGTAEQPPTACPLPPMPTPAPGTHSTVIAESVDPRCNGGDLSPAAAADLMADAGAKVTVIDTRTSAEYERGHLPGAVNQSTQHASFWDEVGTLPLDGVYILYCRSGSATRRVVKQMLAMGFGNVCHIESGFNGWVRDGFPVEKGES